MKDTVLKISLAGLMHDIGKFVQGCINVSPEYRENNETIYQPVWNGRYSHQHALYTAAFIEKYKRVLPRQLNARDWGEGDAFINLAACHHKPETPMQWIIAQADRISSGLDRASFEKGEAIAWQSFKKTRLLPIMESLGPDRCSNFKISKAFSYRYPLAALSATTIFPVKAKDSNKTEAADEYQKLFNEFVSRIDTLYHRDENIELWTQHFDSLLMTYTAHIPAARVGDVVHDVSLYDHARTTAAFAAALYLYHNFTDTMEKAAITDSEAEKFLLVSGDFYGIQEFIFNSGGESKKFRSKLLRGRSFAVSLFSELAADMLCKEIGLTSLSVILNAAGKFHLIAPNTQASQQAILKTQEHINKWLFKVSYGESSIGITYTSAAPKDFMAGDFHDLWHSHILRIEEKKYNKIDLEKHGGAITDFLDSFNSNLDSPLCPLCGKRPSVTEAEHDKLWGREKTSSCAICRDHILLGSKLVKGNMLAILDKADNIQQDRYLLEPIFGRYQLTFTNSPMNQEAAAGYLLKLWTMYVAEDGSLPFRSTVRLINGHVPLYQESDNQDECLLQSTRNEENILDLIEAIDERVPKTFTHIAIKARHYDPYKKKCYGTEAIGVLKADIDHLGMLFGCGLTKKRFTLSRLATVSRQLNDFFSLYLPHLLRNSVQFYNVYTVFAGGDDLFLIGPWNRMADLAAYLHERFADYVCHNPEITFSVGITIHKPHIPVDKLANASEEALEQSKVAGRNRVTMFGETVTWDDFIALLKNRETMQRWLDSELIAPSMFYRFNYLTSMAAQEKQVSDQEKIEMDDMECLKWRSMFLYSLARNVKTKEEYREKALKELEPMAKWLEDYRGAVRIPLWQILYERR